jgi:hypothetical protein
VVSQFLLSYCMGKVENWNFRSVSCASGHNHFLDIQTWATKPFSSANVELSGCSTVEVQDMIESAPFLTVTSSG